MSIVEFAMKEMQQRLSDDLYTDDWKWNDEETAFEFTLFEFKIWRGVPRTTDLGTYRFCYDPEDALGRRPEKQVSDWLNETFE